MVTRDELSIQKIRDFKIKDAKAMEDVVDRFMPLIKACSWSCVKACGFAIDYEDTTNDMVVVLIETILGMPLSMVASDSEISRRYILAYIRRALYRQCKKRAGKINSCLVHETEYNDELEYIQQEDLAYDSIVSSSVSLEISRLPRRQKQVVRLKYQGYSGDEIGAMLGISSSAVSQALKSAREHMVSNKE